MDQTAQPSVAIHSFVSTHSSWVCGPRVNFKARETKLPGKAVHNWGMPEQDGQSVW